MPRERSATRKASQKLTPRLSVPVAAMPATHHQNGARRDDAQAERADRGGELAGRERDVANVERQR